MLKMVWIDTANVKGLTPEEYLVEKFSIKGDWNDIEVRGVIDFMNEYADENMFDAEDNGTFEDVFGFAYTSSGTTGSLQTSLNDNYTEHVPELGNKEVTLNSLLLTHNGIVLGIWWDENENVYYSRFN